MARSHEALDEPDTRSLARSVQERVIRVVEEDQQDRPTPKRLEFRQV